MSNYAQEAHGLLLRLLAMTLITLLSAMKG